MFQKKCLAQDSKESSTSDYGSGDEAKGVLERRESYHPSEILASTLATKPYEKSKVFQMTTPDPAHPNGSNRVYKLVLTGGPCGGKTTGQDRLATFFEQLGWKVFTVPETATILLGGGVKFAELSSEQAYEFQKDLLLTLIKIEDVFFHQAEMIKDKNVLVICDRGAMDPSAYMDTQSWERLLCDSKLVVNDIRERRYDQVSKF